MRDTAILSGCAVGLLVVLTVTRLGYIDQAFAETIILSITAGIVLWYTIETARLRRDAETRSVNEARPRIYFEAESETKAIYPVQAVLPDALRSQDGTWARPIRFILQNFTANPARARVTARLKVGDAIGRFGPSSPYGGTDSWQIDPFFRIRGVFDIMQLVRSANSDSSMWLDRAMTLSVQVDLYWPGGERIDSSAKEYHFKLVRKGDGVSEEFWREVSPAVMGTLDSPDTLPDDTARFPHFEEPRLP